MLTERQQAILVGTLLGDGHLEKNGTHTRLKVDHGSGQGEYVQWKYREFNTVAASKPTCVEVFDKRTNKYYRHWRFATKTLPVFDVYKELFYEDRRKRISFVLKRVLVSPLSLAVWYMDDGYLRKDCRALHLSTQAYSEKEHEILKACLQDNFGIVTRLHWASGKPKMYIPSEEAERFCQLIQPYVIPSMYRKLLSIPVTTSSIGNG